ncbi:hypothetical protein [Actinomyces glycerinitolerans]|uniref:Prokaryotic membrane lipoprotein lipid attachment site profile n=1 Tax=Actinomyces glycerinitolerans TaxID=1892869 RepID=A0A1M4S3N9_9ACTO|nr:hypothetical protein [Actinomyces glycerinitolerans]SHE26833.1 Hypothetical protein ACGLYG10_3088 [Actinomyces glycerinitolerans]
MTRLSRRTALTTAFTAVLAASLAACSGSDNAQSASTATTQETLPPSPEPSPTPTSAYTMVEFPDGSYAIMIPSNWASLTSDDADDDELVNAYVQATGQDADTVRQKLATYQVICAGPVDSGETAEITGQVNYDSAELPMEPEVIQELEESGIEYTDLQTSTIGSYFGLRTTMSYTVDQGGTPQYVSNVYVLTPEENGTVTVTASTDVSAERAQELVEDAVPLF